MTHTLRAEGFDASEDGTGRGTPLVVEPGLPVGTLHEMAQCMAFKESQSGTRLGDVHATLDSNKGSRRMEGVLNKSGVRRLMPVECEALQAFPRDWTRWGADGKEISDSSRYRCLGNAVTVSVVEWIARRLIASSDVCETKE